MCADLDAILDAPTRRASGEEVELRLARLRTLLATLPRSAAARELWAANFGVESLDPVGAPLLPEGLVDALLGLAAGHRRRPAATAAAELVTAYRWTRPPTRTDAERLASVVETQDWAAAVPVLRWLERHFGARGLLEARRRIPDAGEAGAAMRRRWATVAAARLGPRAAVILARQAASGRARGPAQRALTLDGDPPSWRVLHRRVHAIRRHARRRRSEEGET